MTDRKITPKQSAFVQEYLVDMNATQAALRAGYSQKTAAKIGHELLRKSAIVEAINRAMASRAERTQVTADRVLTELGHIGFSNIKNLFDKDGNLLPMHMLPDDVAASVASVDVVTSRIPGSDPAEVQHTVKIKLWSKPEALGLLGKHQKLFTDRIEVDVGEELAARIKLARERAQRTQKGKA